MATNKRPTVVVAQVILVGNKRDHGLGPGVIAEVDVHLSAFGSSLPLSAQLAYTEDEVIKRIVKIKWKLPKKGKTHVSRSTRK